MGPLASLQEHLGWVAALLGAAATYPAIRALERICVFVLAFWSRKPDNKRFAREVYRKMLKSEQPEVEDNSRTSQKTSQHEARPMGHAGHLSFQRPRRLVSSGLKRHGYTTRCFYSSQTSSIGCTVTAVRYRFKNARRGSAAGRSSRELGGPDMSRCRLRRCD